MHEEARGSSKAFEKLVSQILEGMDLPAPEAVHSSALVEIESYTRHVGVRDLDPSELRIVVRGLLEEAMEKGEGEAVNAGAIREVLRRRCDSAFTPCYEAALSFLASAGLDASARRRIRPQSEEDLRGQMSSLRDLFPGDLGV